MSLALEQRLPKTESSDMHVCPICSNCQTPASSCLLPMCGTSLMHKFYIIHRFLQGWSTKILSRLTDLRNCFFFSYYICMKLKGGIFSTIVPVAYLWPVDGHLYLPFLILFSAFPLAISFSIFFLFPFHPPILFF